MAWNCKAGCSDCCGPVPISKATVDELFDHVQVGITGRLDLGQDIILETQDGKCAFLDREQNRCAIYGHRPQLCRDYGHLEKIQCPYIKMNGNPRSPAQVKRMQRQIGHKIDACLSRFKKKR